MAPLPVLLDFINHLSWGHARLEIVRLRLEPGTPLARAWMVCRGSFQVRLPIGPGPSAWNPATPAADLLIDPDSPLLWQQGRTRVSPTAVEKSELPPASGGKRE